MKKLICFDEQSLEDLKFIKKETQKGSFYRVSNSSSVREALHRMANELRKKRKIQS